MATSHSSWVRNVLLSTWETQWCALLKSRDANFSGLRVTVRSALCDVSFANFMNEMRPVNREVINDSSSIILGHFCFILPLILDCHKTRLETYVILERSIWRFYMTNSYYTKLSDGNAIFILIRKIVLKCNKMRMSPQ